MQVEYLEIVTPEVDVTCEILAAAHGISFGDPVPELGFARVATLAGGGRIGVRAPLRETEETVVRPYMLVEDIEAAAAVAEAAGGAIAVPPTEIPGQGTFAIYLLGGIQHGLWQR
ncbi:hydroxylase [Hyphomonas sp.]|uniref:hydroxylase n=1 Tax=Hyphomonas sp. TaxID=87 RepID=UPI003528EDD9